MLKYQTENVCCGDREFVQLMLVAQVSAINMLEHPLPFPNLLTSKTNFLFTATTTTVMESLLLTVSS